MFTSYWKSIWLQSNKDFGCFPVHVKFCCYFEIIMKKRSSFFFNWLSGLRSFIEWVGARKWLKPRGPHDAKSCPVRRLYHSWLANMNKCIYTVMAGCLSVFSGIETWVTGAVTLSDLYCWPLDGLNCWPLLRLSPRPFRLFIYTDTDITLP